MSIFSQMTDMLASEKEHNLQKQEQCEKEIANLPKGSISSRKRRYGEYFYLNYYDSKSKKKVIKYIKDKSMIPALQKQLDRRKHLEKELKEVCENLEAIEKILNIANKQIQKESVRGKLKETSVNPDTSTEPPPQPHAVDIQKTKETSFIERREH